MEKKNMIWLDVRVLIVIVNMFIEEDIMLNVEIKSQYILSGF